jgi:hypothetical protein
MANATKLMVSGGAQIEMKAIGLAMSIMVASLGQSFAQPIVSGKDIKESCQFVVDGPKTEYESAMALHCMGLVRAVLFLGRRLQERDSFCPPDGTHVTKATSVFVKYLNENPEKTQLDIEDLAIQAFRTAWPCK